MNILTRNNTKRKPRETMSVDDTIDVTDAQREDAAVAEEIERLEKVVAEDRANETDAERKQRELAEFSLTPRASKLLADAMENVGSNTGSGIADEKARAQVAERAALVTALNYDLPDVIECIVDNVTDPQIASSTIYSTCFAVQKAANFVANMAYRRALDPGDGEGEAVHDTRYQADPPCGLGSDGEEPVQYGNATEHPDTWVEPHFEVLGAFEELHVYLQLLAEAFGWDAERPMPYLFVPRDDDGVKFDQITDAEQALDIMEVRRQQSRARRQERQTAALGQALAGAKKALLAAGKRKAA